MAMASTIAPPFRASGAFPQISVVRAHSPRGSQGFHLRRRHCLRGFRLFPRVAASSVEPVERDRPFDTLRAVPTELEAQVRSGGCWSSGCHYGTSNTVLGKLFYKAVATPDAVRSILCQCYHDTSKVTEELVQKILQPGLEPGAAEVFLEFICYSGGPLPEELLPQVKCPVLVAWGDKDPWEPVELGRAYGEFDTVEDFVVLPNVGHCPQDETPELVNPLIESFVAKHFKNFK